MKWTLGIVAGISLVSSAIGCSAPSIQPTYKSSVSSTLATYDATTETTNKYGIVKWRLKHSGDGSVLEGLDKKGKSISHVSLAVRKGKNASAAMFWFKGTDNRQGFIKGTAGGTAKLKMPGSLANWTTAARRDLMKFAATGKTPYGCADDIFGILGGLLQEAPKCAKTDTLQACSSKLMQGQSSGGLGGALGGIGKLFGAAKSLSSCLPSGTGSSSSSGQKASNDKPASSKDSDSKDSDSESKSKDSESETEKDSEDTTKKPAEKEEPEASEEEEKKEVQTADPAKEKEVEDVEETDPKEKETKEETTQEEPQQEETEEAGEVPPSDGSDGSESAFASRRF